MNPPKPARRRRIAGETRPNVARVDVKRPRPAGPARPRSAISRRTPKVDRRRLIVFSAAVLVLVAGVFVGAWGFQHMQQERDLSHGDAQTAAQSAATAVEEIFTYDYRDIAGYADRTHGLVTPRYAKAEYDDLVETLREQAVATQTQMDTTVHAAATMPCTGQCSRDTATVLVVTDRVTLNAAQPEPAIMPQRLEVSMLERDGSWLVDEVTYLGE